MKRLKKKDPVLFQRIVKKLRDLAKHPESAKPLRNILKNHRRIQFGHFVVKFTVEENIVKIMSLDHHDSAY